MRHAQSCFPEEAGAAATAPSALPLYERRHALSSMLQQQQNARVKRKSRCIGSVVQTVARHAQCKARGSPEASDARLRDARGHGTRLQVCLEGSGGRESEHFSRFSAILSPFLNLVVADKNQIAS